MLYISQYSEADCRRILRQNLKRYAINDVYARVGKRGFLMRKNVARIDRNYKIPVEKTLLARFCGEKEGKAAVSLRIWNGYLWPALAVFWVLTFGILWGASHRFMQAWASALIACFLAAALALFAWLVAVFSEAAREKEQELCGLAEKLLLLEETKA